MPKLSRTFTLMLCCVPVVAWSQVPLGPKFRVNTYTTSGQFASGIASDAAGGFVVVWHSAGQDGSGYGVFGRLHDATGTPLGATEFRVNASTLDSQSQSSVAMSTSGPFVAVWSSPQDGSDLVVFGRRFDSAGLPGPEFPVNTYTTGRQSGPAVAANGAGNFVVVWTGPGQYGNAFAVFGQRFDATGTRAGPEFQVNSHSTSTQYDYGPAVAMAADGSFVVVWAHSRYQFADIHGQRYDPIGARIGAEFRVNTFIGNNQVDPAVVSDSDGNFVVVWTDFFQDGSDAGVFGQRYDVAGAPQGGEFQVNMTTTGRQWRPAVAMDADGGFVVVWTAEPGSTDPGVLGRRFDASGNPEGPEFRLSTDTTAQGSPYVSADESGDFVTVWTEQDGSDFDVFAQRFRPELIFRDDFETTSLAAWSASATDGGDLSTSIFAAMDSTTVGLQGVVDDTAGLFVQDDSPDDDPRYRARFYLDPNGFDPGEAQVHFRTRVFIAFSEAPTRRVAAIVLRRLGGAYSIRGRARLDDNSQLDTPFFPITDGPHAIELDLKAASGSDANDGHFVLWIDGGATGLSVHPDLDNSLGRVDLARMGALSVKPGANGTMYWDEFESRRQGFIGP